MYLFGYVYISTQYIILVTLVRMSNRSFAAPFVVAGHNELTPDRSPLSGLNRRPGGKPRRAGCFRSTIGHGFPYP